MKTERLILAQSLQKFIIFKIILFKYAFPKNAPLDT